MKSESVIQSEILARLGRRRDVRIWRASTGGARHVDGDGRERWARHGKKGQADLIGVLTAELAGVKVGVHLEVEVKSAKGRLSKEQSMHLEMVRRRGGCAFVARSADEAEQMIALWLFNLGAQAKLVE